jgi:hypothetical protein
MEQTNGSGSGYDRLAAARAANPRNSAALRKVEAQLRNAECCAGCLDFTSSWCSRLRVGVKRTQVCRHVRVYHGSEVSKHD